jgi:hypothetical protein
MVKAALELVDNLKAFSNYEVGIKTTKHYQK